MFQILFYSLLFFNLSPHDQQYSDVQGRWAGHIQIGEQQLAIELLFSYSDGELDGLLDIPEQQAYNLPVEVLKADDEGLHFQFQTGTGPALFKGVWNRSEGTIAGEFEQIGQRFPFQLRKRSSVASGTPDFETELLIPTRAGQLSGSLMLQPGPAPLVILLTGSGSQDRDETVAGFRVFQTLALGLYESGYSTFRYDDRGVGLSRGNRDATLQDLAADLMDVTQYLWREYGESFSQLVYLGHSQGGLVAAIAAQERAPDALVLMGTPFLRGDLLINDQIRVLSANQGISEGVLNANLEFQERIYDVVRSGSDWSDVEDELASRLRLQLNQLPQTQRDALGEMDEFIQSQIRRQLSAAKSNWFKSFIEYEPAEGLAGLQIPLLAIFGSKDTQVSAEPNRAEAGRIASEYDLKMDIRILEGANHLFQEANTGMPGEYGMLDRSFSPGFIPLIVNWLDQLRRS
ncbi:MAG: alpha/beta hydrolase [Balneolaceae bacterium]|nr:MAG: alpha/beta hydrolase [Balneolaceae bacterium]